ncbi:MAG: hypothetical protein K9G58_03710 [Bacteroidales bacterium]|nr:hypothetical protein [Bacteroidales bacterium]MCF8386728.1 hypothetical protein [Bacteroidales bacterium]MCF8397250.1 hypothetical protein [Bacteroidales bacterium]
MERNGKEVIVHFQLKNTGDPIDLALKNNDGSYALGKNGRKYKLKKLVIGNQKSSRLVGKRSQKLDKNKSINGMAIFDVPDETNDFKEIKISSKNKFSAKFKNVKTKDKKPSPSKRFKPSSKKLEKPRK